MPPRKTVSKKVPINIQRATEQRLIDSKILRSTEDKKKGMSHVVAWSAFLGFVAGGIILVYFLSVKNEPPQDSVPQITVPKATTTEQTLPPSPVTPPPAPPVEVQARQVLILDTPTGFLNVRSGPGTNFAKIGQVLPGEIFDLVSTDTVKGWYEVRLTATSTGWVTGQYARILTP